MRRGREGEGVCVLYVLCVCAVVLLVGVMTAVAYGQATR